jgi:hypothetical protein
MPEESLLKDPEQVDDVKAADDSPSSLEEELLSTEEAYLSLLLDDEESSQLQELPERQLARFFAAFLGPMGMIVTTAVRFIHAVSIDEILKSSVIALGVFSLIGYIAGLIVEYCIEESVEEIVAEVVDAEPKEESSVEESPDSIDADVEEES